jgi:alcohol dehydrogenase class IV
MSICALIGGLVLANSKLGVVHGFVAVVGGEIKTVSHGALCSLFLEKSLATNFAALQQRDPDNEVLNK